MSALLFHCFEMCDLPFSPFYFILFEFPLLERKTWLIFVVLWNIYIHIYIYIFFFFEIWNLEFRIWNFLFEKGYPLFLIIFEIFFYSSLFIFLSFKRTKQKFYLFFFLGVDWVNSVKPELTQQPRWNKRGGGGEFFGPPSPSSSSFYFTSPSSLFSLLALSLFTHFLHLHFLPPHTISSLENHFPKLLNLLSFISLNIFFSIY